MTLMIQTKGMCSKEPLFHETIMSRYPQVLP
jgi:hypothetical protein